MIHIHSVFLILNIFFFNSVVHAENSWFVSLWNQSESEKFCRQVKAEDVRPLANQCYGPQRLDDKNLNLIADDVLRWVVSQEAAKLQIQKDQCLISQLQMLRTENKGCNLWHQKTVMAWLASRQTKLKFEVCKKNNERAELKNICADVRTQDLMKNPDHLFRMSIPLVNNIELLQGIDEHRKDIWVKSPAPGHAITNEDILNINFETGENLQDLKIDCTGRMIAQLNSQLQSLEQERKELLSEIQNTKTANSVNFELSEDINDRLYEEGSILQVLDREGLLPSKANNFTKTPAAACVLAYHDKNITAELTEFGGTSAIGMATSLKVLLKSPSFLKLSKIKKLKEIVSYGMLPVGVPMFAEEVKHKCFGIAGLPGKQVYIDGAKINLSEGLNLPNDIPFEEVDITPQFAKIPACKNIKLKSWAASEAGPMTKADCVTHFLLSALPFRYAVPAMFINSVR